MRVALHNYLAFHAFCLNSPTPPFTPPATKMHINLTRADQDRSLLVSLSEPRSRRLTAKKYGLSSGCLPLLAALVFRSNQRLSTRPRDLYRAEIVNEKLARTYLRELIGAGLAELSSYRGCRYLRPTVTGLGVAVYYARETRTGAIEFLKY